MKTKERTKYLYIPITVQSIALLLIADTLGISKYKLFLLYETFSNDCFLFFELFKNSEMLKNLTEFRLKRCFQYAESLTPVFLGARRDWLSTTEQRAYRKVNPYLFESMLRIAED